MSHLPVPVSVLNAHCAVLGKTGAGKSSLLRVIVEDLLRRNKRVVVIDPKGDWHGLALSADGKSAGYPVIKFGDFFEEKASDVPINEHSGKHVAELISSGNRPCIIGFRGWMPGKMTQFWIDFASTLFNSKSGELYLVVDECHNFMPKGKVMDPQAGKCLHWSNRIMSEARGLGIVALIASQRPQKVHNDSLTCCETLFAMRVVHAADRSAIEDWIDGCGDKAQGKLVLDSLAMLARGEAFVWSPENSFGPKRVQFPMFTTFDSFASPQLQKKISAAGWAGVDLDAVKQKLAAVIEEAKANDPAELKARIRELERKASKAPEPAKAVTPEKVFVVRDEDLIVVRDAIGRLKVIEDGIASLHGVAKELNAIQNRLLTIKQGGIHHIPTTPPRPQTAAAPRAHRLAHAETGAAGNGALSKCERAILTSLAQYPQGRTANQVAVLTGYSGNSGGFNNSLSKLRSSEFISRGQPLQITGAGLGALGEWEPLPTGEGLQRHWLQRLSKCEAAILSALLAKYPDGMMADEVAEVTGYEKSSGGFNNSLSRLRILELITRDRPMRASEDFFQ
jgi:hypothetical protein